MGQKHIGFRKNLRLVDIGHHTDVIRQRSQALRVHSLSAGNEHIHISVPQGPDAGFVKIRLFIENGAHGDKHKGPFVLLVRRIIYCQGGAHKRVVPGKALHTGLILSRGINHSVRKIVVLHQGHNALFMVAVCFQLSELRLDPSRA